MAETDIVAIVVGAGVEVRTYPGGSVIFVKEDIGHAAYVVKSGRVEIREAGGVLEAAAAGEIFGEVAMIDEGPRSASAVAVEPTEVYIIDRATFERLIRNDPDFVLLVMRAMARRLRAINAKRRPQHNLPIGA